MKNKKKITKEKEVPVVKKESIEELCKRLGIKFEDVTAKKAGTVAIRIPIVLPKK